MYVLDVTPIYRDMPLYVKFGLDPRLASSHGIPEEQSHTGDELRATSRGTHLPSWERGFTKGDFHDREAPIPSAYCAMNNRALRWHRVHALGNHVKWTHRGLRLVLPPKDSRYAAYNPPVSELELERGKPFYGYPESGSVVQDGSSRALRFPVLQYPKGSGSDLEFGQNGAASAAVGFSGPLGWLGVPTVLARGFSVTRSTQLTSISALLSTLATVEAEVLTSATGSVEFSGHSLGENDTLSGALDDKIVFWGLWSDEGDQQGQIPVRTYATDSVETPATKLGPSGVGDIVPNMVFPNEEAGTEHDDTAPATLLEEVSTVASHNSDGSGNMNTSLPDWLSNSQQWHLAAAMRNFIVANLRGSWGSNSAGFSEALFSSDGFALWPGVARRIERKILADMAEETVTVLSGGCTFSISVMFNAMFCA